MPLNVFYKRGGTEWPGGPETELDLRFKGVGKFVAARDPKRIAVNYLEKLGSPVLYEIPLLRSYGISHTDFNLLVQALGDRYAGRIVSAEHLITDFLARPVKSEIVLFKKIREMIAGSLERQFESIKPGVTRFGDLEGGRSVVDKDGNRRGDDDVLRRGDLICLAGNQNIQTRQRITRIRSLSGYRASTPFSVMMASSSRLRRIFSPPRPGTGI